MANEQLYRWEPCRHGKTEGHHAPDENSYLSTYWCNGGYRVAVEPATTVTIDRENGAIIYNSLDVFDLPSGEYAIVRIGDSDEMMKESNDG